MKDYNIVDYRIERWDGFKDYYIKEMYIGDNPDYPALNYIADKLKLTQEQRFWIAFLYETNYCVPTTYYMFKEFPDFENIYIPELQHWWEKNKEKTYFQTDRVKIKNFNYFIECVKSYKKLIGKNQEKAFNKFFEIESKQERYIEVYKFTNKLFYFGKITSLNYLELINNLTDLKIELNGLNLKQMENTRNGLCYACNIDEFVTLPNKKPLKPLMDINYRCLQEKLETLIYEIKKENKEIDVTYYNIKKTLCNYEKLFYNTRYLGYYIDKQMEDIIRMSNNVNEMDWEIFWEFREKFHHPQYLGEYNDWNGIREKNKHYVTKHGIIDVNEFPNYKSCLKKVDLQSTKKLKPISSLEYAKRRRKIKKVEHKKIWEYF